MDLTVEREARARTVTNPCEAAVAQWTDSRAWAERWNLAVFAVGVAVVISLILAIGLAVLGQNGAAIASAVGGIVTGVAMGWVVKNKNQMTDQLHADLKTMNKLCPADRLRALPQ